MGRKSTLTDKRERRYIRISDADKWELIDKLSALDYGLPLLIKAEFGDIEDEEAESGKVLPAHSRDEEFYGQVVRLMKEMIMNANINKALLASLFEAKSLELNHQPVSAAAFDTGCFQDLPKFAEDYELRTLRSIKE